MLTETVQPESVLHGHPLFGYTWLSSFKEVQIKAVVVEMKVLLSHGKWENP